MPGRCPEISRHFLAILVDSLNAKICVMPLLVLAFLLIPLLEIYLLIEIGGLVGVYWTVAAVVGTALAGAALVRRQGLAALHRFRVAVGQGELPALTIMEGLVLLVAGALLLTPGFFTDALGFACLTPPLRRRFIQGWLATRLVPGAQNSSAGGTRGDPVEGEFRRLDD